MHGIINLDKPKGLTSQDAVTRVKRALGVKSAGHAGTLDPMATGVLLVCVGEGTKASRFLMDMTKEYRFTMLLGARTDTLDAEGRVIEEAPVPQGLTEDTVLDVIKRFTGAIMQVPPMYSALKRDGKALYELARKGQVVEREPREVVVHELELESFALPELTMRVVCSKGTYVRTLVDDLGVSLGSLAHMTALRRLAVGRFTVKESFALEGISASALVSIDSALRALPEVCFDGADEVRLRHGNPVKSPLRSDSDGPLWVRIKGASGVLLGVGNVEGEMLKVQRLFGGGEGVS